MIAGTGVRLMKLEIVDKLKPRVIEIGLEGPRGPRGPMGPEGPQGPAGVGAEVPSSLVVIGTSTAGWTILDCDYLCDGVDDQEQINAAIGALPDSGGTALLLEGAYNLTGEIHVIGKNNITLMGQDEYEVSIQYAMQGDLSADNYTSKTILHTHFSSGSELNRDYLEGVVTPIEVPMLLSMYLASIVAVNAHGLVIRALSVRGTDDYEPDDQIVGVLALNCRNVTIELCKMEHLCECLTIGLCANVWIRFNIFLNFRYGVYANINDGVTIEANLIDTNERYAYGITTTFVISLAIKYNRISCNITDIHPKAINVESGSFVTIRMNTTNSNIILNTSDMLMPKGRANIAFNTCQKIEAASPFVSVVNNTCSAGIILKNLDSGLVYFNQVQFGEGANPTGGGIEITLSSNTTVKSNVCEGNFNAGLAISDSNNIYVCNQTAIDSDMGIAVLQSSYIYLISASCRGNSMGIVVQGSDFCEVVKCVVGFESEPQQGTIILSDGSNKQSNYNRILLNHYQGIAPVNLSEGRGNIVENNILIEEV